MSSVTVSSVGPGVLSPTEADLLNRLKQLGSQTARGPLDRQPSSQQQPYGRFTVRPNGTASSSSNLPPPPLPRAALQLPRTNNSSSTTEPIVSFTARSSHETHRISRWVAQAMRGVTPSSAAATQPVTKQVEAMFWQTTKGPQSQPPSQQFAHHHHHQPSPPPTKLSPLHSHTSIVGSNSTLEEHALESAQQTINAQRMEIEILKRQTQAQMQLDLTYEDLQNENRSLRQLKYVIQELERKLEEVNAMREERKQKHDDESIKYAADFASLSSKYEALLVEFMDLKQSQHEKAVEMADLQKKFDAIKDESDEYRIKLQNQTEAFQTLQSSHTAANNDVILANSQLDSMRSSVTYLKSELESVNSELFSMQRVREMQQELISTLQQQNKDAQSKIGELELQVSEIHTLSLTRAKLVESQKELRIFQETLAKVQTKNDTLESLLEEYQMREKNGWYFQEDQDDDDDDDDADDGETGDADSEHAPKVTRRKGETDIETLAREYLQHEAEEEKEKRLAMERELQRSLQEEEAKLAAVAGPIVIRPATDSILSSINSPQASPTSPTSPQSPSATKPIDSPSSNSAPPKAETTKRRRGKQAATPPAPTSTEPVAPAAGVVNTSSPKLHASSSGQSPSTGAMKPHTKSRTPSISGMSFPPAQTSLSRKLEKCLNDTLRDNTRLSSQMYQLQLQNKSLEQREDLNTRKMQVMTYTIEELQREKNRLTSFNKTFESELAAREKRIASLRDELNEEKTLCSKRSDDLRLARLEISQLREGAITNEISLKEGTLRLREEVRTMRETLNNEIKAKLQAEEKIQSLSSELNTLLSQHGVTLKAKEHVLSSFTKTMAVNSELNARLIATEAQAAKSKIFEDKLIQLESVHAQTESRLKKVSSENEALQTSLQHLSESHTEQQSALQRALLKSQQQQVDNNKLATRVQALLSQLNSEDHSRSNNSSQSKALQLEVTALQDRVQQLESQLTDEKKLTATRLESYRMARKENQTNKTKLFNMKSNETKLKSQLDKEQTKYKALVMENLRLRALGGAAAAAIADSRLLANSSSSSLASNQASVTNLHSGLTAKQEAILSATISNSEPGPTNEDEEVIDDSSITNVHSLEGTRPSSPSQPPEDDTATPMGVLVDFNLPNNEAQPSPLSSEELANLETARKREEARRMKRRVPKRASTIVTSPAGGENKESEEDKPSGSPRGFYADAVAAKKKPTSKPSVSRRPSAMAAAGPSSTLLPSSPKIAPPTRASSTMVKEEEEPQTPMSPGAIDPSTIAAPFLDPFVAPPKTLPSAQERLKEAQQALSTLVDLHAQLQHDWDTKYHSRQNEFESRLEKLTAELKESQERSEALQLRTQKSLKFEQDKYDTLLANSIKNENLVKQLKTQIQVLKSKNGS